MSEKTTAELAACAERELRMRLNVYPGWVDAKRLPAHKAAHEIACMTQIAALLRERADAERAERFPELGLSEPAP